MSRKLSKIMMICVLAAIFPLMIVGVTLASYYSIGKTVEVDSYTDYAAQGDAYASVVYNNDAKTSFVISDSHMKKVELAASATGYDFQGWFAGSKDEYIRKIGDGEEIEFISEDKKISFGMTEYENVLAVFSIKEYAVTYKQDAAHGLAADVNANLMYGKQLLVPENDNPAYDFVGWKVEGEEEVYANANFGNEANVELVSVWKDNAQVNVNFYDGETLLDTNQGYATKAFELPAVSTLVDAEAGYSYAWADAQGNEITQITLSEETNVYVKKSALVYALTINAEDIEFNGIGNANFTKASYADVSAVYNANNWTGVYSFYKLGAISYAGNTYASAEDLVAAIVAANPNGADGAVEIEVAATKNFAKFNSGSTITTAFIEYDEDLEMWVPDEKRVFVGDEMGYDGPTTDEYALDRSTMTDADSSMKVVDILQLANAYIYNKDGEAVKVYSITVSTNKVLARTVLVDEDTTVEDVIESVVLNGGAVDLGTTFSFTSMEINFVLA